MCLGLVTVVMFFQLDLILPFHPDTILNAGLVRCKKYKTRKMAKFSDVWTGQYMTFAKEKETGDIYAWGLNNYYQLGQLFKERVKQDAYNGVALVIGSGVWGIRKHICRISICCGHVIFLLLCVHAFK